MTSRTLLLDLDGALIVDIAFPDQDYAAYREGRHFSPKPAPDGALTTTLRDPQGRARTYFYLPRAIDAVRAAASAGIDVVWNTNWLASEEQLRQLAAQIGLADDVRFPTDDELPVRPSVTRIDFGPNQLWEHWKVQALVERVRTSATGCELVLVDADLDYSSRRLSEGVSRRAKRNDAIVGWIHPKDELGLDDHDIAAIADWAHTGTLPEH